MSMPETFARYLIELPSKERRKILLSLFTISRSLDSLIGADSDQETPKKYATGDSLLCGESTRLGGTHMVPDSAVYTTVEDGKWPQNPPEERIRTQGRQGVADPPAVNPYCAYWGCLELASAMLNDKWYCDTHYAIVKGHVTWGRPDVSRSNDPAIMSPAVQPQNEGKSQPIVTCGRPDVRGPNDPAYGTPKGQAPTVGDLP